MASVQAAAYFELKVNEKMYDLAVFMEENMDAKFEKNNGSYTTKGLNDAYEMFLDRYMILNEDGNYKRNEEMWENTGSEENSNYKPKKSS